MNLILCGSSGTGKTSAIKKVLAHLAEPAYGFWSEKLAPDAEGKALVYLHGCREQLCFTHCIGICKNRHAEKFPNVFDTVGVQFLSDIPEGSLVLMDEIGFMESDAELFIKSILRILDGNYRVIAAVRDKETPLLDAIRNHPKSVCVRAEDAQNESFFLWATDSLKGTAPINK